MKNIFCLLLGLALLTACARNVPPDPSSINIVPKPVSLAVGDSYLYPGKKIWIHAESEEEKQVAAILQELLKTKDIASAIGAGEGENITLVTKENTQGQESYLLDVNKSGITLTASSGAGFFYAVQTLMQLFPIDAKDKIRIPYVTIQDNPRFAYRGLHLDVGRHMFPVESVKRYIDLMARHKFNRFHWHLTEDQGWRIEIKKYPKLQEISAYRDQTVTGRMTTKTRSLDPSRYDKKRYGGFYTQEEIKEVVKYAADRYITVIPEIEMPGHALAALAAYPALGCTGGPYKTAETWGIFTDVFCAGKEDAFVFLQDVLDEVIPLFPGEYIHIGGDECFKDAWKVCPHCQKRIKKEKLKDEHALQSYFIQRIEKYVNSKGKKIIGWDEILEGGLAPNATVMSWRGEEGGIAAAQQGHDVIMSPTGWCYFDYVQDTTGNEPLGPNAFLPLSKVYAYDPLPAQLTPDQKTHILGVQANVWTEYIADVSHLDYMVYPRACAVAEVGWSAGEGRSYEDFLWRMRTHVKRLDEWQVNYAKHILKDLPKDEIALTK